tara:strand:+ start:74 stop:235 length:162 start_codon:yes stop_codon:yes gene_type:complete
MNLEEYKIFHALSEEFKKAAKDGCLKLLLIDQRNLKIRGESQNYEWTLVAKKK